ncbi:MAG TPA: L-threonylcarbamoyladenylate synthase [Candidatus Paceibacterota bacterium]|nr:L-threonylcarbamoyladenylate synthase [Candidatus Paceibacterota bacterium]
MEILKVEQVGVDTAAARAAAVIAAGGVVIYPTDTLYGIGVNALDRSALKRMRSLKMRDEKKPVSIMVPSVAAISWHADLTPVAGELAHRFLPGKLTLVVPAKEHLPKEVTLNDAIGVRVPDDAFSQTLAAMSEYPITATSANMAGASTPATVPEIIMHFGRNIALIDLFVDDGPRAGDTPSTVVADMGGVLRVLREGALTREALGL